MFKIFTKIYRKFTNFFQINWIKTLYINFTMLQFSDALKFPILIFGRCRLVSLEGNIEFNTPLQFGLLGFGQRYEVFKIENGSAELNIQGKIIVNGRTQFGYDYKIFVAKNAELQLGNMASMASGAKVICTEKIVLGDFCRMGSECQLIDTNFHDLKDTVTNILAPKSNAIVLGNYNFISNRVTILSKAKTPDYCTIASNSLLSKSYINLKSNVLIGGIPAKLIKENITRDWEGEKEKLENYLTIKL